MANVMIICVAAVVTFITSHFLSRVCSRQDYLPDHPNERSSHQSVTPRSGGLAIMAGWLAGVVIVACFAQDLSASAQMLKIVALGVFVLLIGFIDDRFSLSPLFKLSGQFASAALFVWAFAGVATIPAPFFGEISLGVISVFATIFWIVAFMNAYNFMDGAHGIAAATAILVLAILSATAAYSGAGVVSIVSLLLATGLIGFLVVNFPSGRIFMGDNGSQSVSLMIAGLAVMAVNNSDGVVSALFVPTALMPFLFDVAFTLTHRTLRRRNILSAHREHLYQLLLRRDVSHVRVTVFYTSLTALSSAAALLLLSAPASIQWLFPSLIAAIFLGPALLLYFQCQRDGFFRIDAQDKSGSDESAVQKLEPLRQAAE